MKTNRTHQIKDNNKIRKKNTPSVITARLIQASATGVKGAKLAGLGEEKKSIS
jgi:hypothetical protein